MKIIHGNVNYDIIKIAKGKAIYFFLKEENSPLWHKTQEGLFF